MQLNTIWVYLFTRPCHSSTQLVNRNKLNVGQLWRGVQQKYHYCSSEILFLCCQGNRATKKYLSYDWMNLIYCMINLSNLLVVDKILFSCLRTVTRLVLYQVRILARTSRLLPFMHTTFYTILWVSLKPWQCHERSDNDWGVSLLSKPPNCPFKPILKHCNLSSCFSIDPGLWPLKYKEHLASPFYLTFSLSRNHDPVQSFFYRT